MKFSYLGAELLRRPRRSLAALLSITFGVALLLSLQAYSSGYRLAARAPLAGIGADIAAQRQGKVPEAFEGILFPHSTAPIHRDEIDAIRRIPGVEDVGESVFFWDFEKNSFLVVLGLDPASKTGPARLGSAVLQGRFLETTDHDVAVADATYARSNNLSVGDLGSAIGLVLALSLAGLPTPAPSLQQPLPGLAAAPMQAASMTLPIEISPATLALALLISAAGGTVSGWLGARKAAGLRTAKVLRDD